MPTPTCRREGRRRHGAVLSLAALSLLCACSTVSASPEELAAAIEPDLQLYLEDVDDRDRVRAVVVQHEGQPVIAHYAEANEEDYWDTRSVTKSVVSILVGIAIEEGHIDGVDQTLGELLPSRAGEMSADTAAITLEQVLTHTAGFPALGLDDEWGMTDDWVGSVLASHDKESKVGTFAYSDAGAHLVAAVLAETTGVPVLTYAREKLFDPLGIDTEPAFEPHFDFAAGDEAALMRTYEEYADDAGFAWPVDPQGLHEGGCCVKLRPQDLAAIGQLYLDEGRWEGEQLVPAEWVRVSTQAHVRDLGVAGAGAYGYLWWVEPGEDDEPGAYMAFGRGGQVIHVTPDAGLVVAVATEYDERDPTRLASQFGPDAATRMVELTVLPHVQP